MLTHTAADALRRDRPELGGRPFDAAAPARLFSPGPAARIVARMRAHTLDRALSQGADPARSPRLAARAAFLTRRPTRDRLAAELENLVGQLDRPARRGQVRPPREAIIANRAAMTEVAVTLRGTEPVYAGGVAALRLMVRDGAGPMYQDRHGHALSRQLAQIRVGLRG